MKIIFDHDGELVSIDNMVFGEKELDNFMKTDKNNNSEIKEMVTREVRSEFLSKEYKKYMKSSLFFENFKINLIYVMKFLVFISVIR